MEVDEQQVNLTRFSLLLPEKREFFLEGRGIFDFAALADDRRRRPATGAAQSHQHRRRCCSTAAASASNGESRHSDRRRRPASPARSASSASALLNIQTGDDEASARTPSDQFHGAARSSATCFRRSAIGAMVTNRSRIGARARRVEQAYGVDGIFYFFSDLTMGGYLRADAAPTAARTTTRATRRASTYSPDRYGAQFEHVKVGDDFKPEVGFLRRRDFERTFGELRYSPRPKNARASARSP